MMNINVIKSPKLGFWTIALLTAILAFVFSIINKHILFGYLSNSNFFFSYIPILLILFFGLFMFLSKKIETKAFLVFFVLCCIWSLFHFINIQAFFGGDADLFLSLWLDNSFTHPLFRFICVVLVAGCTITVPLLMTGKIKNILLAVIPLGIIEILAISDLLISLDYSLFHVSWIFFFLSSLFYVLAFTKNSSGNTSEKQIKSNLSHKTMQHTSFQPMPLARKATPKPITIKKIPLSKPVPQSAAPKQKVADKPSAPAPIHPQQNIVSKPKAAKKTTAPSDNRPTQKAITNQNILKQPPVPRPGRPPLVAPAKKVLHKDNRVKNIETIEMLSNLHKKGILTDKEFEKKKKNLLKKF